MKKKVVKALCIYMFLMLIFTFISQKADQLSVAKVEIVSAHSGTIVHPVQVEGKLMQRSETAVDTKDNLKIKSVHVNQGDTVTKGQVLYQIDMDDLLHMISELEQEIKLLNLQRDSILATQEKLNENAQTEYARALQDYNLTVETENGKVERASGELTQAIEAYDAYRSVVQDEVDSEKDEVLSAAVKEKQQAYDSALENQNNSVVQAKRALEDAGKQEPQSVEPDSIQISIDAKNSELLELQNIQEKDGQITAPVDSVVTEVLIKTGDLTSSGADIRLADMSIGIMLSVQYTEEQMEFISDDTKVTVTIGTKKIEDVSFEHLRQNSEDSNIYDAVLYLPEDSGPIGSTAVVDILSVSENYDYCIPREALHMDSFGRYFVYILSENDTILGKELTADQKLIEVLDMNNTDVAVQGLTGNEEIINNSSKNIENKSRVMRKDV